MKVKQLLDAKVFDEIYVSSDSKQAKEISEKHQIAFIERDESLCNNVVPWSDVIYNVANSIPIDNNDAIAWCHTTSPLFTQYAEAVEKFKGLNSNEHNGLMTVHRLSEFIVNERARPVNYNWGVWHEYSQNLDTLYTITGALFIAKKAEMLKNRYVVATSPYLFEVNSYDSIDVDTNFDFELAKLMFENQDRLKGSC